jgi:hypothetical protein
MMVLIFILAVMLCTAHASRPIISYYSLMQYTRLISEEHFRAGLPLVVVLPLAVKESTSEEMGYLIEGLHTSGRWPILVYNVSSKMNGNMYSEINKQDSYIILISGPCEEWAEYISRFQKQLNELTTGDITWHSFNPTAKFIVSVMSDCEKKENTEISNAILKELWQKEVMKANVLFLKLSERGGNDLHGISTDSVQGTHLEIHYWNPYENSERCILNRSTLPVKLFTARNFSDIKRSEIFQTNYNRIFKKCPIKVHVFIAPPYVNPPKRVWNNDSGFQDVYEGGWEIELLGAVGNALDMSLNIAVGEETENFESSAAIYVGGIISLPSMTYDRMEPTRMYHIVRFVWYTPCNVKYEGRSESNLRLI